MSEMARIRGRMAAYLGRPVPSHEQVEHTLNEVLDKAEADRADAEAYRALAEED